MGLAVLLIFSSFLLIYLNVVSVEQGSHSRFRTAFIKTAIIFGLIVVISTEGLNFFRSVSYFPIAGVWSFVFLINMLALIWNHQAVKKLFIGKNLFNIDSLSSQKPDGIDLFCCLTVALIVTVCLITAIISPPNNYDSMTYHMPRVMHWIQNKSVNPYPTHNIRQVAFSPGAAYIITHLQLLAQSDRFANMVQWMAFIGAIMAVSLIGLQIYGRKIQWLSALLCATIPIAIMQSTTTQTDLLCAFWLVCFVYFIFRTDQYTYKDCFWLSTSFGMAVITKPTAILFGFPFFVLIWYRMLKTLKFWKNMRLTMKHSLSVSLIALFAFGLSVPFFIRNYETFGQIFVSVGTKNTTIGPVALISNVLRNISLNLPVPQFWHFVSYFHTKVLGISPSNPDITFEGVYFSPYRLLNQCWLPDEDFVSSPLHFVLFLTAIVFLLYDFVLKRSSDHKLSFQLLFGIFGGFLIYCLLIKWQFWANRLMLPLFIVSTPITAFWILTFLPKFLKWTFVLIIGMSGLFYSLTPIHHPIIPMPKTWTNKTQAPSILFTSRFDLYFCTYAKNTIDPLKAMHTLMEKSHCRVLGIDTGWDNLEYLIWIVLNSYNSCDRNDHYMIVHQNVNNQTAKLKPECNASEICRILKIKGSRIQLF